MVRGARSPWRAWNGMGLAPQPRTSLTFTEVNAIKIALSAGRFSHASIARMYDVERRVVTRIIEGTYRYRREE